MPPFTWLDHPDVDCPGHKRCYTYLCEPLDSDGGALYFEYRLAYETLIVCSEVGGSAQIIPATTAAISGKASQFSIIDEACDP
ncbi:MAG TPA: hypothetical protein VG713_12920 [Pirellulales bacterium]|nr:hypothetical protein [Pirellulales bacterium]